MKSEPGLETEDCDDTELLDFKEVVPDSDVTSACEDYIVRGLLWVSGYFSPSCFALVGRASAEIMAITAPPQDTQEAQENCSEAYISMEDLAGPSVAAERHATNAVWAESQQQLDKIIAELKPKYTKHDRPAKSLLEYGSTHAQTSSIYLDGSRHGTISKNTRARTEPLDVFEPAVNGHLQNVDVSAFPDTGAAANFISLPYAKQHRLKIDKKSRESVKVGDGSTIRVVGTTTLPFSFADESTQHDLTFYVLQDSVHNVILGSDFLRASETFTRFAHRVGRKIRESVGRGMHRLCFLESQQYVKGLVNGVGVDAVPDTGADVSVMSARFAQAHGFVVDDDDQHRILLGFVDGSTARSRGVIKDAAWRFGADEQAHLTDVYVLSNLPVDLVLGYEFLCQTEAFSEHERDFWHVEDLERRGVCLRLCIIHRLKRSGKDDGEGHPSSTEEERWQLAKAREIDLYRRAKEEAHNLGLSDDEQTLYLESHLARWQQFLATRPACGTDVMSISPSAPIPGSAASSQAGGAQAQVQSQTFPNEGALSAGKFSMDWFRRKAREKPPVTTAVST